jgi:xylulokinase
MKTALGIDLGTQSIKVLFYDYESRKIVNQQSVSLDVHQDRSGSAEQNSEWWTKALIEALSRTPMNIKQSVAAISISGQQHGFVAVNKDGDVIAPVKLWCDTSTEAQCSDITQRLGGQEACIKSIGNKMLTGYTASKILHLKQLKPSVYAQLDTIMLPHDYLNFWLTGEKCMEMGDASGTGVFDVKNRCWSDAALNAIDPERELKKCLPTLRKDNEIIGTVHSLAAELTGLPVNTPVAIGGGDNMMGAIGTGNLEPGRTTISLGTSGTVYAYSDTAIIDPRGNISAFCSSTGGWLPLSCTMNCTVTTELFRSLLSVDLDRFDTTIGQAETGSAGVLTLPFFNGERTPNLPNAKGCILGLDAQNTIPHNILRSGVEGATLALRTGIQDLSKLGITTNEIIITGGGSKSTAWRQIVANIMGVNVAVMQQDEGAVFGAALQAFCAVEHQGICNQDTLSEHTKINNKLTCEPQSSDVAIYNDVYERYETAVNTISALYQ